MDSPGVAPPFGEVVTFGDSAAGSARVGALGEGWEGCTVSCVCCPSLSAVYEAMGLVLPSRVLALVLRALSSSRDHDSAASDSSVRRRAVTVGTRGFLTGGTSSEDPVVPGSSAAADKFERTRLGPEDTAAAYEG